MFENQIMPYFVPNPHSYKTNDGSPDPTRIKQLILKNLNNQRFLVSYSPPNRNFQKTFKFLDNVSQETIFPDGKKNTRLLNFSSIKAARYLTSFIVGDEKRKCGDVRACTHFLETAAIATNMRHHLTYFKKNGFTDEQTREIIAFVAYLHDHEEDYQKDYPFITAKFLVDTCWLPYCLPENRQHAALVEKLVHLMMDPHEKMKKSDRLMLQVQRAHDDETGVVGVVRLADKIATLSRDTATHETDPDEMPLWKVRRFGRKRRHFVRMLPLAGKYPVYETLMKYLDSLSPVIVEKKIRKRARKELRRHFRKVTKMPLRPNFAKTMRDFGGSMYLVP